MAVVLGTAIVAENGSAGQGAPGCDAAKLEISHPGYLLSNTLTVIL